MSWRMQDYGCPDGHKFELLLMTPVPAEVVCQCGQQASTRISPVAGRVRRGEVSVGRGDNRPPHALDTRDLGDGMSTTEWRARRARRR